MAKTTNKDWVKISEAARILKCHPDTIRNYRARGYIRAHQLPSKRWLFLRSDIEKLVLGSPGELHAKNNKVDSVLD